MTTTDRPTDHHDILSPPGAAPWEGRAFGGIVLAAFLLYGVGSALADQPIGLALVALNSIAVAAAGLIGFRLLQSSQPQVGFGYLATRVAEALLLGGGIALAVTALGTLATQYDAKQMLADYTQELLEAVAH